MLRPSVVRSLRRTLALRVPAHVVSRRHPHVEAAGALAAAGLRVHGCPDPASVSPAHTPSAKAGQPAARVNVHSADGVESLRSDTCALFGTLRVNLTRAHCNARTSWRCGSLYLVSREHLRKPCRTLHCGNLRNVCSRSGRVFACSEY